MKQTTSFFSGPAGSAQIRTSFRRVRGLAAGGIALAAVFFFLYAFRVYSVPDEADAINHFYPQTPLHSGLSDPPPAFYKDQSSNPYAGDNRLDDSVHHQLSDDGPLSDADAMHNPNADAAPKHDEDMTHTSGNGTAFTIKEDSSSGSTGKNPANPDGLTTTIVVGRTDGGINGTNWVFDDLTDITEAKIYIVDDPEAPLHLNKNKGREAMVYMKYIMQHYDQLSDVTIFFHSGRMAWHNNILANKDGAVMINNLRRQHVIDEGYFNLRCELHPGCPQWVLFNATRQQNLQHHPERFNDLFSVDVWDQIFPNRTHDPVYLAEPCCSQYALSRERIRSRPLADYVRIHDFLAKSRVADGYLGRVMEYVWQFLWLDKDEHCPSMVDCYCKGYGICLQDEDATALVAWNQAKSDEDTLLEKLGAVDAEKCNPIEDEVDRKECKKANPILPEVNEVRRTAGSIMEQRLKKYIIKDA